MKFAQSLRNVQGAYSQYVVYKTLKKFIKQIEVSREEQKANQKEEFGGSFSLNEGDGDVYATQLWWFDSTDKATVYSSGKMSPTERLFVQTLESEINRVSRLHTAKMNELKDLLADVFRRINGGFDLDSLYTDLEGISKELVNLDKFTRQSKLLMYKILKKYDRRNPTGFRVSYWMMTRLEQYEFWHARFDNIVVGVSDAYAEVRALEEKELDQQRDVVKVADDVETFERNTAKYFVKAEDVMLVKMIIVKYLPLDIFGRKKAPKGLDPNAYLQTLSALQDATVTNSIYLDNEPLTMYHERTGIDTERGNLIRIRWYGDHVNPPSKVFMERKTRNAALYQVDSSIKERFLLNNENVMPYLRGDYTLEKKLENMVEKSKMKPDKAEKMMVMSSDIQNEIVTKKLGPAVRTVCRRSAFQHGKDQTLRFSLDTNLHMIDETPASLEGKWFRNLEKPVKEMEVVKFPYGVLEVKTQKDPPPWVSELLESGLVISGERFSKFQYGTLRLRRNIRFYPLWFERTRNALDSLSKVEITPSPAPNRAFKNSLKTSGLLPMIKPSPPDFGLDRKEEKAKSDFPPVKYSRSFQNARESVDESKSSLHELDSFGRRSRTNSVESRPGMADLLDLIPAEKSRSSPAPVEKRRSHLFSKQAKEAPKKQPAPPPPVKDAGGSGKKKGSDKASQRTAKTFFANERTLLSWVNTVTFLSLTGLTLLNSDTLPGRVSGVSLILVTIAFALYAFRKYRQRLNGLEEASLVGYEDRVGPAVLVIIFCFVLLFTGVFYVVQDFVPSLKAA
eukprot:TRINITY_DN4169_c0_g1_i1.p1 TRINITY_DN4169_c0_g1~~TRINITY_DN4169_c0_g1_i1.p1  ORF type:complete len:790 (-),score=213.02 TRINITY_DN4169_c0_g1_i1:26-2395(-)